MSYERKMLEDLKMPTRKEVEQALLKSLFNNNGVIKEFGSSEKIVEEIANNFDLNEEQRTAYLETVYKKENRVKKSYLWHRLLFRAADSLAKEKLVSRPTQTILLTNEKEWMLTEDGYSRALEILHIPIIDLLQKSLMIEFKVVNCSNQIETQSESLSAITIPFTQDTKYLQFAKNMFNQNSSTSQTSIPLFLFFCQRMVFGFLARSLAVLMEFCQTLIACICQYANMFGNLATLLLEELKVVLTSMGEGSRNNLSGLLICNQLCFLSMTPFFAAKMFFLAFLGRSTGCSLASTSTTSKTVLLAWSAFFPGRRNFPERTNTSSIF